MTAPAATFAVFQYNILSQPLARATYPADALPELWAEGRRFALVADRLRAAAAAGPTLFALQEVPGDWQPRLALLFEELGYRYFPAYGGNPFNGFMAPAVAVPRAFEVVQARVRRVGELIPGGDPAPAWRRVLERLVVKALGLAGLFCPPLAKLAADLDFVPAEYARRRNNALLSLELRAPARAEGAAGERFTFSTYHMPCAYWSPPVMALHAAAAFAAVREYSSQLPAIFAGDFNFAPDSPLYLAAGDRFDRPAVLEMLASRPAVRTPHALLNVLLAPLALACRALGLFARQARLPEPACGEPAFKSAGASGEPAFTCYSPRTGYKATLDFIFVSGAEVARFEVGGSGALPLAGNEPSDHLPLRAEVELSGPAAPGAD